MIFAIEHALNIHGGVGAADGADGCPMSPHSSPFFPLKVAEQLQLAVAFHRLVSPNNLF